MSAPGQEKCRVVCARIADMPVPALEWSWALPCEECGESCWVDTQLLFGTKFRARASDPRLAVEGFPEVPEGEEFEVSLAKSVLCLQCAGRITNDPGLVERMLGKPSSGRGRP